MPKKVLLIAEFSGTGGTFSYFKQLACLLNKDERIRLHLLLRKEQLSREVLLFIENNRLSYNTYNIPSLNLVKIIGSRLNLYLSNFISLIFVLVQFLYHSPNLIIQSTGGHILFNLYLLPTNILVIQHSLQLHKLDRINAFILTNFLGSKKRMLTVSLFARNSIVDSFQVNKTKISFCNYIYNSHPPISIKSKPYKNKKFTILTLGHVESYKNPVFFLSIVKILSKKYDDIEFIWAGNGSLLDEYKRLTKGDNIINFIGHQENISALYNSADIYFQPSLLESQGISILGAMAAKLPCIVANVGGMPESVAHNETGFVYESNNLNEAVYYVEQLIDNLELCQKFGNNGYNRYQELFTTELWEINMKSFLENKYNV